MERRLFLRNVAYTAALSPLAKSLQSFAIGPEMEYLTILHTNDVHSRVDPFPMDDSRNAGMGGAARRASLIKRVREVKEHVLLLDSGDIFQGTPYFNYFGGKVEFELMDKLGYDAATIGNHDFDAGVEVLRERSEKASFDMLNYNYNLDNSILKDVVKPYKIFQKGEMKIGVFGIGIELQGLVAGEMYDDIKYLEPYVQAEKIATELKKTQDCDIVICLSHLGYNYEPGVPKACDVKMAAQTRNIDMILGGHTHTFLEYANQVKNKDGETVIINQVGWAGIMLGRIDIVLEKNYKTKCYSCKNQFLDEPIDNTNIKHK